MKFCCSELSELIKDNEICVSYFPRDRSFGINYKPRTGGGVQIIKFCPWCGARLPKDLSEEYNKLVFDELKLDPLDKNYKRKLPSEFKTDEWWKKRGL